MLNNFFKVEKEPCGCIDVVLQKDAENIIDEAYQQLSSFSLSNDLMQIDGRATDERILWSAMIMKRHGPGKEKIDNKKQIRIYFTF